MVAPSGVELVITDREQIGEKLKNYEADEKNTLILVKTPETARTLFDEGLALKELNVGGMGANQYRKALYKNISASDEEVNILKELEGRGINVYFQATPTDKRVKLSSIR